MAQFKPQDKRNLLRNFFADERVQILVSQILIKNAGIMSQGAQSYTPMSREQPQVIPAQSHSMLRTTADQVNLSNDLQVHLYASKNPKYNLNELTSG